LKFIAVDIGNVICNVDFTNFISELSKTLNISIDDVNYFLHRTTKLHDLGLTQIGDELRDHFKIKSTVIIDLLTNEWNRTITIDKTMLYFLDDLRIHDTQIALLSNIGVDHAFLMPKLLGSIWHNSIKFFSSEVGAIKPSFLYYKTFLDMYPQFNGCIYLDDRIENIEVSKKFGFRAIKFVLNSFDNENLLKIKLSELKSLI